MSLTLAGVLSWLSLSRLDGIDAGVDLAGYTQAIWLLTQGKMPEASLLGDELHLLGVHWSFIAYVLVIPSFVAPAAKVLLVAQSVALGLGIVPLWRLARRVASLRIGAAVALCLAYSFFPAVHELALDDFHPEALAVPGLLGMAYLGAMQRWVGYWMCVVFVLSCRADLGLAVALWGFLLLGEGRRRPGLWTVGVGAVWSLGLLLVVQPLLSDSSVGQYGDYGDSLGEAIIEMVTHPLDLLADLTSASNVALLVALLAPVIFLPLLSWRHLLPAVPLAALYLVTNDQGTSFAERHALLVAFVFIASTYALARLGDMGVDRVFVDVRLLVSLVAASALLFISAAPSSPYHEPWTWSDRSPTEDAILEATALLDRNAAVRTTPSAVVELAERPWVHVLDVDEQPQVVQAIYRVRSVLIVERDLPPLADDERAEQRETFDAGMAAQGFELIYVDRDLGVLLYFRP